MTAIVWFRKDLRLADNPAWAAASVHEEVLPLFVVDPNLWRPTEYRTRQLAAELHALDSALRERGGRLHVVAGPAADAVAAVAEGADAVYWNDDWSPFATARDTAVADSLTVPVHRFAGTVVHAPGTVLTGDGNTYTVFTPF